MTERVLEGLFKWHHSVTIKDSFGEPIKGSDDKPIVVYQRIIGDADMDLARSTALRHSAILRKKLSDSNNIDRLSIIPDYEALDKDTLVSLIILNELADLRNTASKDLVFPFPEAPTSDATLEQQEEYQEAVDTFFERRDVALLDATNALVQDRQEELSKLTKPKLKRLHETSTISAACRSEMIKTFNEMVTYLATYDDDQFNVRSFSSYSAFRNAMTSIKQQLIQAYLELDMGGSNLKK